jgi:hypothetical protein
MHVMGVGYTHGRGTGRERLEWRNSRVQSGTRALMLCNSGGGRHKIWYPVPYLGIAKGAQAKVPNSLIKLACVVRRA